MYYALLKTTALLLILTMVGFVSKTEATPVKYHNDHHVSVYSLKSELALPATGSIIGIVKFAGTPPRQESFTPAHHDAACEKATFPLDRLVIGKNQGVEYTLVFIKNPPAGSIANMKAPVITQQHCRYSPHLSIAAKGSTLELINNDAVLHNIHGYNYGYSGAGIERSTAFNIAQPIQGQKSSQELRKPGMIEVECDAGHIWMTSWIWVTPNPWATVTNSNGEYSFSGLSPGTYTLVLWHEGWKMKKNAGDARPMFSDPISEEQQVTVAAGNTATANFELH